MKEGDTYGIWTFDQTLNTGFSMQRWSPNAPTNGLRAGQFIGQQKFDKPSSIQAGVRPLPALLAGSDHITIILISDGSEPVKGTPFDLEINGLFQQYFAELKDAKLPFVTILSSSFGKIWGYAVNSSIGPIQTPQLKGQAPAEHQPIENQMSQKKSNGQEVKNASTEAAPNRIAVVDQNSKPVGPLVQPDPVTTPAPAETNSVVPASTNAIVKEKDPIQDSEPQRKKGLEVLEQKPPTIVQVIVQPPKPVDEPLQIPTLYIKNPPTNEIEYVTSNPADKVEQPIPPTPETNSPAKTQDSTDAPAVVILETNAVATAEIPAEPTVEKSDVSETPSKVIPPSKNLTSPPSSLAYLAGGGLVLAAALGLFLWFGRKPNVKKGSSIISQSIDRTKL
jgi:hypothetical protein